MARRILGTSAPSSCRMSFGACSKSSGSGIFPHHENEIAQSEAATDQPFVRHWFHITHLLVDGRKMEVMIMNFYRSKTKRNRAPACLLKPWRKKELTLLRRARFVDRLAGCNRVYCQPWTKMWLRHLSRIRLPLGSRPSAESAAPAPSPVASLACGSGLWGTGKGTGIRLNSTVSVTTFAIKLSLALLKILSSSTK